MEIDYEQRRKDLKALQSEPLSMKIQLTMAKLIEFYNRTEGKCYISCSGGADSMVLYDITQRFLKDYDLRFNVVFDDTGLEEPTVRERALSIENVQVVRPEKSFWQVLTEVGYPIISKEVSECVAYARRYFECGGGDTKHSTRNYLELDMPQRVKKIVGTLNQRSIPDKRSRFNCDKYKCLINAPFRISNQCCNIMKKRPMKKIKMYPIIATMAEESVIRATSWYQTGCNSFEGNIASRPMSFWTKQDVLQYIRKYDLKIAKCYGAVIPVDKENNQTFEGIEDHYMFSGCQRTGCIFCMFGCHLDTLKGGINRFAFLKQNNPELFDYCMRGGKFDEHGLWIADRGLGMAFVIEWLNRNLKKGKRKFIEGVDLSDYQLSIKAAFAELEKLEPTRKKWLKGDNYDN